MRIRTEINQLADSIRMAAQSYDGSAKICLAKVDTTISDLSLNLLGDHAQGAKGKLDIYESTEMSLKGRIETASNLLSALEGLNAILSSTKNTDLTVKSHLATTIQRVEKVISSAILKQEALTARVPRDNSRVADKFMKNNYLGDLSLTAKIKNDAFRTIKNLELLEGSFANYGIGGERQLMSFLTLQKDLEIFLFSYNSVLTDKQRFLITDLLPLLSKGAEVDKEILRLEMFRIYKAAPDEFIESKIADIAYDIEKSIDSLKRGETFIFPGGYTNNGGHSILYEVQRVRDDEYHFSIFNTGLGSEFGQDFFQAFKMNNGLSSQSRVPLFTNIKKEALVDQKFIMDLIRFQIADTPGKMDTVHSAILEQLKLKFSSEWTTREPHDLQSWGTCSYDSLAAFLEYKLPPSIFIPFQYDMMLRARGELNSLLPQASNDPHSMHPAVLKFIDTKSCETISKWKTMFEEYCALFGKDDLTLTRIIMHQNIRDQNGLKKYLESLSDYHIADENKLRFFEWIGESIISRGCLENGLPLYKGIDLRRIAKCSSVVPFGLPFRLVSALFENKEEINYRLYNARKQILWRFQDLIKQESPEAAKILENRNQELGNGNQLVLSKEIDLSGVFDYLKRRFEEVALCIPHLLDPQFYPLNETIAGCPNQFPVIARV